MAFCWETFTLWKVVYVLEKDIHFSRREDRFKETQQLAWRHSSVNGKVRREGISPHWQPGLTWECLLLVLFLRLCSPRESPTFGLLYTAALPCSIVDVKFAFEDD